MTTGTDIAKDALLYAGISGQGNEPAGEDIQATLRIINDMLAQWSHRRWLVYNLVDTGKVCTGALNYSIGPGGFFDFVARPDRIEAAYVRLLQGGNPTLYTDYMLERILAREDYSRITLKQMKSFPNAYFYDSAYPLGYIYPWPVPDAQYELHILTRTILERIDVRAPGNELILPDEYAAAIKFNAARRLRMAYRYPSDPELNALAQDGINTIRGSNVQVPLLQMPAGIRRNGRYNFYSDTVD